MGRESEACADSELRPAQRFEHGARARRVRVAGAAAVFGTRKRLKIRKKMKGLCVILRCQLSFAHKLSRSPLSTFCLESSHGRGDVGRRRARHPGAHLGRLGRDFFRRRRRAATGFCAPAHRFGIPTCNFFFTAEACRDFCSRDEGDGELERIYSRRCLRRLFRTRSIVQLGNTKVNEY